MSLDVHHDPEHNCLTLHLGERFDFSMHRAFHDACLAEGSSARSYVVTWAKWGRWIPPPWEC